MDLIFNENSVSRKRRIAQKLIKFNHIYKHVEGSIIEHLELMNQSFDKALVVGLEEIKLPAKLAREVHFENVCVNNNRPEIIDFDLVVIAMTLHHENNPLEQLKKYQLSLKPGGMMLISFFGGDTFHELREPLQVLDTNLFNGVAPRMLPKISVKDAARLIQKSGLSLPIADCEQIEVRYSSIDKLILDIKSLGLGNCLTLRDSGYIGKNYFKILEAALRQDNDKGFAITYDLITAIGRKARI